MKTLSKKERMVAYKKVALIAKYSSCIYLKNKLRMRDRDYEKFGYSTIQTIEKFFPEFYLFRPFYNVSGEWWEIGSKERTMALLFAAEMCK